MNYFIFFLAVLVCIHLISCKNENKSDLTIVGFENVDEADLQYVRSVLENEFKINSLKIIRAELPEETYYKPRNRYRADKLIGHLRDNFETGKVMGVTDKDISTTSGKHKDWGIMGLAFRPGKSCVISTFRTFRGAKSIAYKRERLRKVAFHEFGHTLGLPHCTNSPACLMRDAGGKASTVDETSDFCRECKSKIQHYLKD